METGLKDSTSRPCLGRCRSSFRGRTAVDVLSDYVRGRNWSVRPRVSVSLTFLVSAQVREHPDYAIVDDERAAIVCVVTQGRAGHTDPFWMRYASRATQRLISTQAPAELPLYDDADASLEASRRSSRASRSRSNSPALRRRRTRGDRRNAAGRSRVRRKGGSRRALSEAPSFDPRRVGSPGLHPRRRCRARAGRTRATRRPVSRKARDFGAFWCSKGFPGRHIVDNSYLPVRF